LRLGREPVRVDQDQYEKQTRDDIIARIDEIKRIAAQIEAAAKAAQPLPNSPKEYLKKISAAIAACQSVIEEHAQGDRFSDATLLTVSNALQDIYQSTDSLILYAAMNDIRAQA
jgi:hypothetical protein